MIDHHDQAVTMAMDGHRSAVRPHHAELRPRGRHLPAVGDRRDGHASRRLGRRPAATWRRTAMAWMGMPSPVGAMPGMQSAEAIQQLTTLTGKDLDKAFFTMMRDHHLGGVHMALYAARARQHEAGPRARGPDRAISTGGSERVHASNEATRPREFMTDVVLDGRRSLDRRDRGGGPWRCAGGAGRSRQGPRCRRRATSSRSWPRRGSRSTASRPASARSPMSTSSPRAGPACRPR